MIVNNNIYVNTWMGGMLTKNRGFFSFGNQNSKKKSRKSSEQLGIFFRQKKITRKFLRRFYFFTNLRVFKAKFILILLGTFIGNAFYYKFGQFFKEKCVYMQFPSENQIPGLKFKNHRKIHRNYRGSGFAPHP